MSQTKRAGEIVAGDFKDKVDRQEMIELIRLLGHIRTRSVICVGSADLPFTIKETLQKSVLGCCESLRVVLEEVKNNVR